MKYYAAEGHISQSPIEGGVEISAEQYQAALAGIAQGHVVTIEGGFAVGPKPEPETPEPAPPTLGELAACKRAELESSRHAAEAEGIIYNGIRYAGDPGNRQAMREALEAATDMGLETFASWKDSDGQFHANHPVADVWAALRAIAARRSQLIEREGQLVGQIDAILADGDLNDAEKREALETIEWSEA